MAAVPFLLVPALPPLHTWRRPRRGGDWRIFLGAEFYDLSFSWFLDGLSLTFALLITGIGTLIVLYAGGYLKGHPQQGRFFSFLLPVHGRDARRRRFGQFPDVLHLLGADLDHLLPADRLRP